MSIEHQDLGYIEEDLEEDIEYEELRNLGKKAERWVRASPQLGGKGEVPSDYEEVNPVNKIAYLKKFCQGTDKSYTLEDIVSVLRVDHPRDDDLIEFDTEEGRCFHSGQEGAFIESDTYFSADEMQ